MISPPEDARWGQDAPSSGERAVAELMSAAHQSRPDQLPALVAAAAAQLGATGALVHLVDYPQTHLVPVGDGGQAGAPLLIDATLGGWAFTRSEIHQQVLEDSHRMWVPLLDGVERLGVLSLDFPHHAGPALGREPMAGRVRMFTSVVAEMVMTKSLAGDTLPQVARREEMALAAEMQWQALAPLTFACDEVVITGMLEPCYRVGGDTFDYAVDARTARFAIFDAMGHGVGASMISTLALAAYRNARRRGLDLPATCASIDAAIGHNVGVEAYATGIIAELDLAGGVLSLVRAGHPDPLILRGTKVIARSYPLSLPFGFGIHDPQVATEALQPGDRVLLYTDGVTEARNTAGEFFGLHGLVDTVIRETATGAPPPEVMRRLTHAVLAHQQRDLDDDATQLLVEWRTGRERTLQL